MRIQVASYLHGEVVLKNAFRPEYVSLISTLRNLAIPLYDVGPFTTSGTPLSPKRQVRPIGGKRLPVLMPVSQKAMNADLNQSLRQAGWAPQPVASGPLAGPSAPLGLKGDFHRNGVFVEVEFGNTASMHRDFFKFQVASRARTGHVAVLIAATERLAKFFDSNVTTFETVLKHIPYLALAVQMPVCFIGFEPDTFDAIEQRYEQMRSLCQANGVVCHPFSVV